MKGGVVTKLRLIVFLPSILGLWDDKGTLAGSAPQMHDHSQFPKFLVLDKPGGRKSLIEIEGKAGRKESVQKQTKEPTDALRQIEIDIDCNDCGFTRQICCNFGNGTRRCENPKNCPTYGKENGIKKKEICMKEAESGCDDKNPCCDGLSCRIEEGFPPGNLAPLTWKCTKDDYVRDETVKATTQETMITPPHEMKNEGEGCGFPPHGVICNHLALNGTRLKSFGLCKEGLYCQKFTYDCSPGTCRKELPQAEKGSGDGIDLSEPPKNSEIGFSCCKEKGVSDECIGYCGKAGAIGQRLGKQTGKCEKWFEAILKCREGGGSSGPTTEEPKDECVDCMIGRQICCEYGNGTQRCEYSNNCPTYGKDYGMTSHKSRTRDCSNWSCNFLLRPVCGSDGKTYPNKCRLEKTAACEDGKQDLVIASEGRCSGARMMSG